MTGEDDRSTRSSAPMRTVGLALLIGFVGAGLVVGIIDGGRSSIFNDPGLYVGMTVLLALISFPALLIRQLLERGPSGNWPRWKTFERSSDDKGLPIVRWREGSILLPPRQLKIMSDAEGELHLVFVCPKLVQRRGGMQDWLFGLLGPVMSGISQMAKHGGETEIRPWGALTTLEVAPWKQVHGGVGLFTHTKREHSDLLLAWFRDGTSIELSDWRWSRAALSNLSNIIRTEFIERRSEHLQRVLASARNAANPDATERKRSFNH